MPGDDPSRDRYPRSGSGEVCGDLISHSRLTRRESTVDVTLYVASRAADPGGGINAHRSQLFNSLPSPAGFRSGACVCVCVLPFSSPFHFLVGHPSVHASPSSRVFRDSSSGAPPPPPGSGVPRLPSPASFALSFRLSFASFHPRSPRPRGYAAAALTNFIRGTTAVLATAPGLNEIIHRGTRARQIIHGTARVIVIAVSRPPPHPRIFNFPHFRLA